MQATDPNIEDCARFAHEVNRAYCTLMGDHSQQPWDEAPDWQRDSARNGVMAVIEGLGPEELHERWAKQKIAEGWHYGETKDPEAKTHPCLLPYPDLPPKQRIKDELFSVAVRAAILALGEVAPPVEG